jgi:hypothetical protein
MVIVRRSLEAAKAISAGNSNSLIASVNMIGRPYARGLAALNEITARKLTLRLAQDIFISGKAAATPPAKSKRLRQLAGALRVSIT